MVNDGEDRVVSMAVRELSDQVYRDDFEWLCEGWYVYFVLWCGHAMCERFVLLIFGTFFDIVFDPF